MGTGNTGYYTDPDTLNGFPLGEFFLFIRLNCIREFAASVNVYLFSVDVTRTYIFHSAISFFFSLLLAKSCVCVVVAVGFCETGNSPRTHPNQFNVIRLYC